MVKNKTKKLQDNSTQIVCILDRSGSMRKIIDDAIGGFNSFLDKQKKLDEPATMTVALFDDKYDLLYDNIKINKVEEMTVNVWSPRGLTALYDAIGRTINTVKDNHKKLSKKEKPSKVLVVIVTDGLENDSKEYSQNEINKLIKEMEKKDWNFLYLAANQSAFSEGTSIGISGGNTLNYKNTSKGNKVMFDTLASATTKYRSMAKSSVDYADISTNLMDSVTDGKGSVDEDDQDQ